MQHTSKSIAEEFKVDERSARRYIQKAEQHLGFSLKRRVGNNVFIPDEHVETVRNIARGFDPSYRPPAEPVQPIEISPPARLSLPQESPREEFNPELDHLARVLRSASPTVEKTPVRIPTPEGIPQEMGLMLQRKNSQKALMEWGAIAGLFLSSFLGIWYMVSAIQPHPRTLQSIPSHQTYTPKIRDTGF